MENEQARSLLDKHWPGMDEVLTGLMDELDKMLEQDWIQAKVRADGPAKFKAIMTEILEKHMAKMERQALEKIAASLMAPIIFNCMADIGKVLNEKKGGSCK